MLREKQAQEMSNLLKGESFEWSILILDKEGQDIISPLFIMTDLMEIGVVQCLRMEDPREPNLETRAVYFVKETEQNVNRIIEDIKENLYSRIEVLFTGIVSTPLLKDLAIKLSSIKEANKITRIIDVISMPSMLHDNIYTLNVNNSFVITEKLAASLNIYRNTQNQTEMIEYTTQNRIIEESIPVLDEETEEYFKKITLSLLSIFKHMPLPAVYYNNEITQRIAHDLLERVSEIEELQEKKSQHRMKKLKKPLVILLTRTEDLIGPMYHTNSYGAMLNEIFDFSLNKLVIHNGINQSEETYNLNRYDTFYNTHINEPFTAVVDKVNEDLLAYKELSSSTSINMTSGNEDMIKTLIKLPDLVGKNRLLYNHLNIVLNAIEVIKSKHLDELFSIEEGTSLDMAEVEEIISKLEKNELIRLCAVASTKFSRQYAEMLKIAEKQLKSSAVVEYIEKNTVKHGIRSKFINNLKKMIGVGRDGIIRLIESVYNRRTEDYSSINVFILGGGTYDEYKAVMEYGKSQRIEITYGSTEILSAHNLISQIEEVLE